MTLPALYHAHHSRHMEDLPFWLALAGRTGGPILELGCGTGRLLVPLARAGFETFGLDREPEWLAFLRAALQPGGNPSPNVPTSFPPPASPPGLVAPHGFVAPQVLVGPHVFVGDMTAFHLARSFALIFLPCNTLSTLSPADRQVTLACAGRHLRPGGLFAASLPNPAVLRRLPRKGESEVEEEFFHPESGDPVQVSSAWERAGDIFILWWHYDRLLPDGRVERLTIETRHTLAPVAEFERDLASAGLEILERYGDYDRTPFSADSPDWIITAAGISGTPGP